MGLILLKRMVEEYGTSYTDRSSLSFPFYTDCINIVRREIAPKSSKVMDMNKKTGWILVLALLGVAVFFGHREIKKNILEESAVSVVNQILDKSLLSIMSVEVAKCNRVSIVEKIGNNTYTGVAFLDNGNILNVKIQDLGESIVVEIIE